MPSPLQLSIFVSGYGMKPIRAPRGMRSPLPNLLRHGESPSSSVMTLEKHKCSDAIGHQVGEKPACTTPQRPPSLTVRTPRSAMQLVCGFPVVAVTRRHMQCLAPAISSGALSHWNFLILSLGPARCCMASMVYSGFDGALFGLCSFRVDRNPSRGYVNQDQRGSVNGKSAHHHRLCHA